MKNTMKKLSTITGFTNPVNSTHWALYRLANLPDIRLEVPYSEYDTFGKPRQMRQPLDVFVEQWVRSWEGTPAPESRKPVPLWSVLGEGISALVDRYMEPNKVFLSPNRVLSDGITLFFGYSRTAIWKLCRMAMIGSVYFQGLV